MTVFLICCYSDIIWKYLSKVQKYLLLFIAIILYFCLKKKTLEY